VRIVVLILVIMNLISCATIKPYTESGMMHSNKEVNTLAKELNLQANKCWAREWGWFGDGVEVDTRINLRGFIIEARRYAPDIGLGRKPFAEIVINEEDSSSVVQVIENGFNPVSDDSIIPEVEQWLLGDLSCITDKSRKRVF